MQFLINSRTLFYFCNFCVEQTEARESVSQALGLNRACDLTVHDLLQISRKMKRKMKKTRKPKRKNSEENEESEEEEDAVEEVTVLKCCI